MAKVFLPPGLVSSTPPGLAGHAVTLGLAAPSRQAGFSGEPTPEVQLRLLEAGRGRTLGKPSLPLIHEAGLSAGPAALVLAQFSEYRRLPTAQQGQLEQLWEEVAMYVRTIIDGRWLHYPEYTNPRHPFRLDLDQAEVISVPARLAELNFRLRQRVVERRSQTNGASSISTEEWRGIVLFLRRYEAIYRPGCRTVRVIQGDIEVLADSNPNSLKNLARAAREVNDWSEAQVLRVTGLVHRAAFQAVDLYFLGDKDLPALVGTPVTDPFTVLEKDLALAQSIQGRDRGIVEEFLRAVPRQKLRLERVCEALKTLAEGNPPSIPFFLRAAEKALRGRGPMTPERVSERLQRAATFFRKFSLRMVIRGPVFLYYYIHAGDNRMFTRLSQDVREGDVIAITFDERGRYELTRRHGERPANQQDFSYAEAVRVVALPRPENDWGIEEFLLSRRQVGRMIRDFFAGWERRRGTRTPEMMRLMHSKAVPDYYAVRRGTTLLHRDFLSDPFLDSLNLTADEKERLRHLQTLLCLVIDRENEPIRGPYWKPGLGIRYFRFLSGKNRDTFEAEWTMVCRTAGEEPLDVSLLELGWVRPKDHHQAARVAELLEVPSGDGAKMRKDFAQYLLASCDAIDKRALPFEPQGDAVKFPNNGWDIPYFGKTETVLRAAVAELIVRIRGEVSRARFARRLRLKMGQVLRGEIQKSWDLLVAWKYVRYLESRERREEADRLRALSAALELARHPVGRNGAVHPAGRILRYLRYLLFVASRGDMLRILHSTVSEKGYRDYELGRAAMPASLLKELVKLVVEEGIFTPSQARAFTEQILQIYQSLGVRTFPRKPATFRPDIR